MLPSVISVALEFPRVPRSLVSSSLASIQWNSWCVSLVESGAARLCREAGTRVSVNALVWDLDIAILGVIDTGRLAVVAGGLPLFHGPQLAVDTMVSPLKRDASACPRSATKVVLVCEVGEQVASGVPKYPDS